MSKVYIHLDTVDTLELYRSKLDSWKRDTLYKLWDEMRHFHEALEQDEKWYGISHEEFREKFLDQFYSKNIQPLAEDITEAIEYLKALQNRAEELGVR